MILARPFYFLRHGEADWNVARRCICQLDRPLTEKGRAQARTAAQLCAPLKVSRVFHSPLSRAADTAAIVGKGRAWALAPEPGLMEANLGIKQGAREDDPADPFIVAWAGGTAIAEAETYAALKARVAMAVNRCLEALEPGALPPLLVAHAGVYHALRDVLGMPVKRVHHCQPIFHEPLAGTWRVTVIEAS